MNTIQRKIKIAAMLMIALFAAMPIKVIQHGVENAK